MIEFEIRQLERHSSEAYAADALCTAVIRGEPGRGPYRMHPDPDEELYAAFVENEMQGMAQVYQETRQTGQVSILRGWLSNFNATVSALDLSRT